MLAIPTLFGVLVVVFVLLRLAPGDPIAMMIGPGATTQDIAQLKALYGFDQSIATQFWIFLQDAMTGNLGTSISLKREITELLAERLPLTLELSILAVAIATLIGLSVALLGTRFRGTWLERVLDAVVGAVMLTLESFSRLARRAHVKDPEHPMDVDPSMVEIETEFSSQEGV